MNDESIAKVWLTTVVNVPAVYLRACEAVLDAAERERAGRFKHEAARQQYVIAHATLRRLLSSLSDTRPTDWRFSESGASGKPVLAGPERELHFNLSHTRGLIGCVASWAGPVGIDVEWVKANVRVGDFAKILSAGEQAELAALSGVARDRRFYAIWTAKEAYAKARGDGLSESLQTVTILDAETSPRLMPPEDGLRLHRLPVPATHAAIVALPAGVTPSVRHMATGDERSITAVGPTGFGHRRR